MKDGISNPNLKVAAIETAQVLDQQTGPERVYRQDEVEVGGETVVFTTQIPTESSGKDFATFKPSNVEGADGILHTESVQDNSGIPGDGDVIVPAELGIPNHAAYGTNVTSIETQGGKIRLTPLNYRGNRRELRRATGRMRREFRRR